MDINMPEKRLEIWKRILFIGLGASITLLATGIGDLPVSSPFFPGWYGVWFIVQLATIPPGFVLLFGKHWISIPLKDRLNTIFGYFASAWIAFLALGIRGLFNAPVELYWFILGIAIVIIVSYWWLRRKHVDVVEEMFP